MSAFDERTHFWQMLTCHTTAHPPPPCVLRRARARRCCCAGMLRARPLSGAPRPCRERLPQRPRADAGRAAPASEAVISTRWVRKADLTGASDATDTAAAAPVPLAASAPPAPDADTAHIAVPPPPPPPPPAAARLQAAAAARAAPVVSQAVAWSGAAAERVAAVPPVTAAAVALGALAGAAVVALLLPRRAAARRAGRWGSAGAALDRPWRQADEAARKVRRLLSAPRAMRRRRICGARAARGVVARNALLSGPAHALLPLPQAAARAALYAEHPAEAPAPPVRRASPPAVRSAVPPVKPVPPAPARPPPPAPLALVARPDELPGAAASSSTYWCKCPRNGQRSPSFCAC